MSLARSVVEDCLKITSDDNVTINLYPHNISLAEEIADECFKKGADVIMSLYTDRYLTSFYRYLPIESLRRPSAFCRSLTESSTAEIFMSGTFDPAILRQIDSQKLAADGEGENAAHFPLSRERKIRTLNIGLALVTEPRAKTYGFNFEDWNRMMTAATSVDYSKLASTGRTLMTILKDAKSITITGPGNSDLSLDVSGRKWHLSDGVVDEEDIRNDDLNDGLPAGTLYVAPAEDSAEGSIAFNAGTPIMGTKAKGLGLTFREGKVVRFSGNESTEKVEKNWREGTGDKDNIAYFGIGFNPKAEAGYTVNNVAYGGVSVGFGGNEFIGGKNRPGFYYQDTLMGATVKADGRLILQDGKLAESL